MSASPSLSRASFFRPSVFSRFGQSFAQEERAEARQLRRELFDD